jgi:hypothetical protein
MRKVMMFLALAGVLVACNEQSPAVDSADPVDSAKSAAVECIDIDAAIGSTQSAADHLNAAATYAMGLDVEGAGAELVMAASDYDAVARATVVLPEVSSLAEQVADLLSDAAFELRSGLIGQSTRTIEDATVLIDTMTRVLADVDPGSMTAC